jgi:hypothetical protein
MPAAEPLHCIFSARDLGMLALIFWPVPLVSYFWAFINRLFRIAQISRLNFYCAGPHVTSFRLGRPSDPLERKKAHRVFVTSYK